MELIQLLEMSIDEGKKYGNRFFKFFYYDKFYLIDNLKVDVLFRILKLKTKIGKTERNSNDYKITQEEFVKAISEENFLNECSILTPELLDLVSQFQSKAITPKNKINVLGQSTKDNLSVKNIK